MNFATPTYNVGTLAPMAGLRTQIRLPHHGKDIEFNISFIALNGSWDQFFRMRGAGDGRRLASKVTEARRKSIATCRIISFGEQMEL